MTGADWSNALNGSRDGFHIDVKNAITTAVAGGATEVNVYYAGGTYSVTNQLSLSSITIPVKLSGGYLAETDGSRAKGETATTFSRTANNVRHLSASSLSSLCVDGITFSGGYVLESGAKGGAVYLNASTTVISNCVFRGNRIADSNNGSNCFGGGGGVAAVSGNLNLKNCLFSGNYRSGGGVNNCTGGAVYANNANLTIGGCTFDENYLDCTQSRPFFYGAALGAYYGNVSVSNCTFTGNYIRGCSNSGGASAGALAIRNAKTFRMSDSTVLDCYVANASGLNSDYHTGVMLLDDWLPSDGLMTSVVERCVFDSHGVPNTIKPASGSTQMPVRSDITVFGGALFMTNCIVSGVKGNHAGSECSIRARSGTTINRKNFSGYAYYTSGTWTIASTSMELVNCTIADGKTYGAVAVGDAAMTLKNCISYGHSVSGVVNATSIEYSCIQEEHEGEGNFVPESVEALNWTGAPYYHLLTKRANGAITNGWFSGTYESARTAADSPCIDTGAPHSSALDFEPMPHGQRINLGAYGGTQWASLTSGAIGLIITIQ